MADWRQIQARIRKAKNAADPAAKLSELYQRTRDGMVAWEIGAVAEKDGRSDDAVKWYKVAAEKFRRADWKKKAEEALTRLGVQSPENSEKQDPEAANEELVESSVSAIQEAHEAGHGAHREVPSPFGTGQIAEDSESDEEKSDAEGAEDEADGQPALEPAMASSSATTQAGASNDPNRKKRRRGRRGGRGRRRKGAPNAASGLPAQAFASSAEPSVGKSERQPAPRAMAASASVERTSRESYAPPPREPRESSRSQRSEAAYAVPQLPSERAAHGRSDPALSSRMAHLESLLRRLMSSPLHKLGEADEAPAGPGVFLLSESDQSSSYYIESCQTLRVGVSNLIRGARGQRGNYGRRQEDQNLKEKLAQYLGINEAKVSQYLKDHCVVRWIQLDDEAANLAHFAIGILRTPLNVD